MGRRMARRATVAAAVGTTMVISLAGCLGGSGNGGSGSTGTINLPADTALVKASQQTAQADSFAADLTISDGDSSVRANGDVKLRPSLEFTAKLTELKIEGSSLPGVGSQAILTDGTLYARVPQLAQFVTGGKPWLRVNVDQAGDRAGFGFEEITEAVQRINPAEQTKMLTGSKDARRVGEETVDGVRTAHYTGTVTVQDALNRLDPQARERVRDYTDGSDRLAFDIWVDSENLPRKLAVKGTANGQDTSTVTVLYRDFGKDVTVNAPPADQVGDVTGRLDQFLSGN